jgi:hypothetical protein
LYPTGGIADGFQYSGGGGVGGVSSAGNGGTGLVLVRYPA